MRLSLDLSSNDLRVAGAKALSSLLETDAVRPFGTWVVTGRIDWLMVIDGDLMVINSD